MRRLALWFLSTVAVVILLFSYRTSTMGAVAAPPAAAVPTGKGVDGPVVTTRFGPVQVRITVLDGRITEVVAVQHPAGNPRTDQINATALPKLREEALAAQTAEIDTVSGATYSSAGYRESLQAAIDNATP